MTMVINNRCLSDKDFPAIATKKSRAFQLEISQDIAKERYLNPRCFRTIFNSRSFVSWFHFSQRFGLQVSEPLITWAVISFIFTFSNQFFGKEIPLSFNPSIFLGLLPVKLHVWFVFVLVDYLLSIWGLFCWKKLKKCWWRNLIEASPSTPNIIQPFFCVKTRSKARRK